MAGVNFVPCCCFTRFRRRTPKQANVDIEHENDLTNDESGWRSKLLSTACHWRARCSIIVTSILKLFPINCYLISPNPPPRDSYLKTFLFYFLHFRFVWFAVCVIFSRSVLARVDSITVSNGNKKNLKIYLPKIDWFICISLVNKVLSHLRFRFTFPRLLLT